MKKIYLFLLLLWISNSAEAQYFQHTYGTSDNDVLESGVITVGPRGKLMAGYTDTLGVNSVMVTRTAANGKPGAAPLFNNGYLLFNADTMPQSSQGRRVVQLDNGKLAVWGDYSDTTLAVSDQFFLMMLNANGTVDFIRSYSLPVPVFGVQATSMVESPSHPGTLFVCGNAVDREGRTGVVVMSLQAANGNQNWSWHYVDMNNMFSDWTAQDLEESPYLPANGVRNIALVGHYADIQGNPTDGCFFTVSSATGLPTSRLLLYGTLTDQEELYGITVANSPTGGAGFAVCGAAYNADTTPVSISTWAMKIKPNGAVVWTTKADYSILGTTDFGKDIIERVNTTPAFEYYVGGTVDGGIFGSTDALVYKLDNAGKKVANGQFTYGGPGSEDARQLGQESGPGSTGLSVFGNTVDSFPDAVGAVDFYLVKAYFSGESACNTDRRNFPAWKGPGLIDSISVDTLNRLDTSRLRYAVFPVRDANLCFANTVMGGSNARLLPGEFADRSPDLYPNPVSAARPLVTVRLTETDVAAEVEVELWNALGQRCLQKKVIQQDGQTELQLDLGTGLAPGIYYMQVRQGEQVQKYKLAIQ